MYTLSNRYNRLEKARRYKAIKDKRRNRKLDEIQFQSRKRNRK